MHFLKAGAALAGALAVTLCLVTHDAEARERSRSGTWSGSHGGSGTWSQTTQRSRGHFERDRSWTGPRGGGSSSVERSWDRQAGTFESTGSRTTPRGSSNWSAEAQRTAPGVWSADTHYSNSRGRSFDAQSTTYRNSNGYSRSGSYTTGNGGSGTFTQSRTRTNDGWSSSTDVTRANGKSYSRDVDVSRDGNVITRDVTTTGPNGGTRTNEKTITIDPAH